jgi:predicted kinase
MNKLIVMRGLPSSGKSTTAQGMMLANKNIVRVSKDLMRKMLHFGKLDVHNENITRQITRSMIESLIRKDMDVIVDDCNLDPVVMQGWKKFASDMGVECEVIDMTDVPTEECVRRDSLLENSIGGVAIKNMAMQYKIKTFDPNSVVLCDIDGTISDATHRMHFIQKGEKDPVDWKKDWKGFFTQMENDTVRDSVQKILIQFYNEGRTIIFMTGRPDQYRDITLNWLSSHFLTFGYTLIMRPRGDRRPDTEVKKELFEKYFPDKSVIHVVLDDRPSMIRTWKEVGIPVLDVGKGIEF